MLNLLLLFSCLFSSMLFSEYSADCLTYNQQEDAFRSNALVDLVRECNSIWYDVQRFWQANDEVMTELLSELDERLNNIYKKIHDRCVSNQETVPSFYQYLTHLMHMVTKELKVFVNEFGTCQNVALLMHKVEEVQELLLVARERFDVA
jgi:hypothetical protein